MITIDREKCINCGSCEDECNAGCYELENNELKYDGTNCYSCGHCVAVCPRDAIILDGDGYNIEEVEEFSFVRKATAAQVRRDIMMRRSVRGFSEHELKEEEIALITDVARYSPTGKNLQQNALKVVTNPAELDDVLASIMDVIGELGQKAKNENPEMAAFLLKKYDELKEGIDGVFYGAPAVFFVFSTNDIDGALCAGTMGRMMEGLDIGYCYIKLAAMAMNQPALRAKYNIPDDLHCVLAIAAGRYETEYFCSVPRKEIKLL